ncbi:MAG: thioredoxin family protein [Candidatus Nezhaarchaeota archaeon]|nr:thioredoxin family protein [Candidatus Nezhaarchaeota archaeon]
MSEESKELESIRRRKLAELKELARKESGGGRFTDRPLDVTDKDLDEFVKKAALVVVDCWAEWCPPCLMLKPVIEELAKRFAGRALFGKLNVDENLATVRRFSIAEVPTLLVFKEGRLVGKVVGYRPLAELEAIIKAYLQH